MEMFLPRLPACTICIWLLGGIVGNASGDALSELPMHWQELLQAVDETDISGAEPAVLQTLAEARQGTAALLVDPGATGRQLSREYGALGNLYQVYKVPALAEQCYANARTLAPDDFRWAYYAAYLALEGGRVRQSVDRFEQAARLDPAYAPVQLHLGKAWYELNELEKARDALQAAAGNKGLRAAALYYLGQIDLLERDFPSAIDRLQEVLKLDPRASAAHYPLARAYRAAGDAGRAREHLALRGEELPRVDDSLQLELQALQTGGRPFFASAMQAIEQGDYPAAAEAIRQGLERDPDNLNAQVSLGRAQYLAGQREQAGQTLRRVLARDPGQVLAGFLLGVLQDAEGDSSAAESAYRRVLQLDSEHAGAHFFLANQLMHQERYSQAASHYRSALATGQQNPFASLYLVVAGHRAGKPEAETLSGLRQELERHPELRLLDYALVRLLASCHDPLLRDPPLALQLASDLVAAIPAPPHLEALALAQAASGDFEQAIALQNQLLAAALWMGAGSGLQRLQETLQGFEERRLPEDPLPADDPLLTPPPVDAHSVFREYPSPVPF